MGDPAAFVRDHWATAPLLRRGAGPDGFDDLLSLDGVDRFLSATPRAPAFRLVKAGETVVGFVSADVVLDVSGPTAKVVSVTRPVAPVPAPAPATAAAIPASAPVATTPAAEVK